jgi:hypothetical protein
MDEITFQSNLHTPLYLKFTLGIMQYALSVDNYNILLQDYKHDHRSVTEQKLMLNGEQKERPFDLLKINALEENRYYDYRFYEDNCTTRAKGIINNSTHNSILFKNILTSKAPTYRELIHKNLDSYHQYWSRLAIDFLLGSNQDKQITNEQAMFLPEYLMQGFDSATLQQYPLVSENKIILKGSNTGNGILFITPFNLFSLLALVFIILSFSKKSKAQKILRIADAMFFFSLGLLGILIVFVWAGRVDSVCTNNLNVLWPWLPQQLNIAFAPLLIIIMQRGYLISSKARYAKFGDLSKVVLRLGHQKI